MLLSGIDCGCGSNGRCNDGAGAGTCICNPGYEEVDFLPLNKCQDVDQCMDDPCEKADFRMCRDLPGDFECICAVGTWDGEQCGMCSLFILSYPKTYQAFKKLRRQRHISKALITRLVTNPEHMLTAEL